MRCPPLFFFFFIFVTEPVNFLSIGFPKFTANFTEDSICSFKTFFQTLPSKNCDGQVERKERKEESILISLFKREEESTRPSPFGAMNECRRNMHVRNVNESSEGEHVRLAKHDKQINMPNRTARHSVSRCRTVRRTGFSVCVCTLLMAVFQTVVCTSSNELRRDSSTAKLGIYVVNILCQQRFTFQRHGQDVASAYCLLLHAH